MYLFLHIPYHSVFSHVLLLLKSICTYVLGHFNYKIIMQPNKCMHNDAGLINELIITKLLIFVHWLLFGGNSILLILQNF